MEVTMLQVRYCLDRGRAAQAGCEKPSPASNSSWMIGSWLRCTATMGSHGTQVLISPAIGLQRGTPCS